MLEIVSAHLLKRALASEGMRRDIAYGLAGIVMICSGLAIQVFYETVGRLLFFLGASCLGVGTGAFFKRRSGR